jgi:trehalose 6-phosphate phosphatase
MVSGRPLEELRLLVPIPGITHVGTHGLEIAPPTGDVFSLVPSGVASLVMVRLQQKAASLVSGKTGLFVENKRHAIALHYRLASQEVADAAISQFVASVRRFQRQGAALEIVRGKKVVEVRPVGVNKGKALQILLTQNLRGCVPLYIGDDKTDEDAFQMVNRLGGISIIVAENTPPSAARYYLHDPDEVNRFLTCLLGMRSQASSIARH